jgi:transcriptional regulator with XRE-family HTH domain
MLTTVSELFRNWLLVAMESKGMRQADLARATGMTSGGISHILNEMRKPSPSTLKKIAKALGMPTETIYRAAGLLPDLKDPRQEAMERLGNKLDGLSTRQMDELDKYIDFMRDRDKIKEETTVGRHRTKREGITPPEVVKG